MRSTSSAQPLLGLCPSPAPHHPPRFRSAPMRTLLLRTETAAQAIYPDDLVVLAGQVVLDHRDLADLFS